MGFESYHPGILFLFFLSAIAAALGFSQPAFVAIACLCAAAYSIKRNGRKAIIFDICLLFFIAAFVLYYTQYHHFGMTVLRQNLIGNNMTWESLIKGIVWGVKLATVMMWCSCLFSVFTADKVVYLFGRVSPKLSLYLSILLRLVPRIKAQARKIHTARKGVGRGIAQGNLWQRVCNGMKIFSMLITWVLDSMTAASDSMRSRGYGLRGRTAFSIYRFDNRDRSVVIGMFLCLTALLMAVLLEQTRMVFAPLIVLPPVTGISYLFYAAYLVLCLLPMGLELYSQWSFARKRSTV